MQQNRFSKGLRAIGRVAGVLAKASAIYSGILAFPSYTSKVAAPDAVEPPQFSMTMDGFESYAASLTGWKPYQTADARRYLATYRSERGEFLAAVEACRTDPSSCPANLTLVIAAAQDISRIQDPTLQVVETQAFVESLLRPDTPESVSPVHNYTFLGGIDRRYGACPQKSFLKFAMLEMEGLSQSMAQMVFETVSLGRTRIAMSHVVVEVNLNGEHMIMDDREDMVAGEPLDATDVWKLAVRNSFMMSDRNQTNRTARNPFVMSQLAVLNPSVSVSAKGAGIFKPVHDWIELPTTVVEADFDETVQSIDLRRLTSYPDEQAMLTDILVPAIATNYKLKPAKQLELSQR